jgi:hypothetical protein
MPLFDAWTLKDAAELHILSLGTGIYYVYSWIHVYSARDIMLHQNSLQPCKGIHMASLW